MPEPWVVLFLIHPPVGDRHQMLDLIGIKPWPPFGIPGSLGGWNLLADIWNLTFSDPAVLDGIGKDRAQKDSFRVQGAGCRNSRLNTLRSNGRVLALVFIFGDFAARAGYPVFSTPVLGLPDIAGLDLIYEFIAEIFSTIPAHFPLIVEFPGLLGSEINLLAQIAEVQVENLFESLPSDREAAFVTVSKVLVELGRQLDGFGFVASLQALADIWLIWGGDSALPDGGHGVGALVDDHATVAQFPFGCGMKML